MSDRPQPRINAFSPEYLSALRERDETSESAMEAELAGPWTVREHDQRLDVERRGRKLRIVLEVPDHPLDRAGQRI